MHARVQVCSHRRPIPAGLLLAAGLCALLSQGGALAAQPQAAPPMPGRLVEAGGHRLHLFCSGSGGPEVVFEAGAGAFSVDFALVQAEVARFTRACSYDRAGYAWSEPGPRPRTMRQIAYELHTALHRAGVKPPYVLVGHSLGGLMVRVFARQYPREVSGLVLVDSTSEDTVLSINGKPVRMRELAKGTPIPPVRTRMPRSPAPPQNGAGGGQSDSAALEPPFDRLPPEARTARSWAQSLPTFGDTNGAEFELLSEEMQIMHAEREREPHPLGDRPLIVLVPQESGADAPGTGPGAVEYRHIMAEKRQQKREMVQLSTNSLYVEVPNTRHEIHIDQPQVLARAIRAVVEAARKRTHLPASLQVSATSGMIPRK